MTTDLDISPGALLTVRNMDSRETAGFRVIEAADYKGQVILYGETTRHGIRMGKGTQVVPARPGCFVYILNEDPKRVLELSVRLHGLPLVLLQNVQTGLINLGQTSAPLETRAHPILNSGRIPGVAGFMDGAGRDGMILKAMRLVDIYWDWRDKYRYRYLPTWVRFAQAQR